jgi:hypothetical protein
MGIRSINEPGSGHITMVTPASVNEPPTRPDVPPGPPPAPVITSLTPTECTIGDDSFPLYVHGTDFYAPSVIVFAGNDEPTTLNDDGTLSTGINMDVWKGADTVKVSVRNGNVTSNEVDFTFNTDDEQSVGVQATKHRGTHTKTLHKRR